MVEAAEREAVEGRVDVEGAQRGAYGVEVEVAQLDVLAVRRDGLVFADQRDAHGAHVGEVVIEGGGGLGRCEGGQTGAEVVFEGPVARTAALDHAAEHDRLPGGRGAPDALGRDAGRRRHDQLDAVLDGLGRVEQDDVLGAGADVYGEDPHATIVGSRPPVINR